MKKQIKKRLVYFVVFLILILSEIIIALFVKDRFIRPYGGDILVTALICVFIRIFFPEKIKLLPVYVYLFAFSVEIGQYFDLVKLLGLSDNRFFSILLGTTFSFADLFCYALGCLLFWLAEMSVSTYKRNNKKIHN